MRPRCVASGLAARRRLSGLGWGVGLGLLSLPATAQQAPARWALKITPQYVVMSGLWLEAEHARPAHPKQTFTFGTQLYAGPTGRPDVAFDPTARPSHAGTVQGVGGQAEHRFYWTKTGAERAFPTGFYLSYGPMVQFFHLGFAQIGWHEETSPTGLPYLVYGNMRHYENVVRYGAAGHAGYQWALASRVLLDVYAGVGVRKSHYWSAFGESQFRSGPSDYAHEGVYFPAGFKLGVALR